MLTNGDLSEALEVLPVKKAHAAEQFERARETYELAKARLATTRARTWLVSRCNADLRVDDHRARVEVESEAERLALVQLEVVMRRWALEVESYDDRFTGVKVIVRLRIAEMGGGLGTEERTSRRLNA